MYDRDDASNLDLRDASLLQEGDVSRTAVRDVFAVGTGDVSLVDRLDASPTDLLDGCRWCRGPIPPRARRDSLFCSRRCRQAAFRIRRRHQVEARESKPMRMAYADPPYPGMAWLYRAHKDFAGEVDHPALVARLEANFDGFALSTSARSLGAVLPLFTRPYRVCAWVKPIGAKGTTYGIHNTWEPLIVVPGRELRPGKRDWLAAMPARGGGSTLIGRKPEAFVVWLFGLLGLLPGDHFEDLFPGSGLVGRAWRELSRSRDVENASG